MSEVQAMAGRRDILPPNATALERAVDRAVPQWDDFADAGEPDRIAQRTEWLAQTAAEWQLVQFAPYFESVAELLAQGRAWRMRRGTAASVRQAMGWLGYDAITLEQDGFLLHIDPGRLVADADLLHIARVVRASLPLHEHFYRIYHGLDLRALRYDGPTRMDSALWDNDSGTWVTLPDGEAPIKVAQWEPHTTHTTAPSSPRAITLGLGHRHTVIAAADTMAYDGWAYDSETLQSLALGSVGTTTLEAPAAQIGAPLSLSVETHTSVAVTQMAAPISIGHADTGTTAPIWLDDSRSWMGEWDDDTWARVCETFTTPMQ